eukprot:11949081-Alexandrium_andersonii.AAC.1
MNSSPVASASVSPPSRIVWPQAQATARSTRAATASSPARPAQRRRGRALASLGRARGHSAPL